MDSQRVNYFFSIITITYNCEAFIEKTIQSVLEQNFKDFEYIIIDGNSSDATLKIINKYRELVDIIVSEPDQGIYDAMNKGLNLAKGKFVNFLNAGDTFVSNDILGLVEKNITIDIKIISGDFNLCLTNNLMKPIKTRKLILKNLKKDFYACHQSIFIHQSIANNYDKSFKIKADYKWVLSALEQINNEQVYKMNIALVNYEANGYSAVNYIQNLFELIKLHYQFFGGLRVFLNIDVYLYRLLRDIKNRIIT